MPDASAADPIDHERLKKRAGVASFERLFETTSTMERARAVAEDPAALLPAVIVADRQTHGRGRRGAAWWQPPGSLAVSVVYEAAHLGGDSPAPRWSLACGVALAESIRAIEPSVEARVRWPNDVEAAGRKLAGILVETAGRARVIFGIGVNTTGSANEAPETVRHRVATLPDLVGRPMPRAVLVETLLVRLESLCREMASRPETLLERFAPLCALRGRPIRLYRGQESFDGICAGIAIDGSLLLRTDAGIKQFASGTLSPPGTEWKGDVRP